jgi:uncharacterized protein YjbI with pentapeptide repeats
MSMTCRFAGTLLTAALFAAGADAQQAPTPVGTLAAHAAAGAPLSLAIVRFQAVDASAGADTTKLHARVAAAGGSPEALLAGELTGSGRYQALDEGAVSRALASAAILPDECLDLECALKVGRALGVERVMIGRVSKLSTIIWYWTATMFDVPGNRVVHQESIELKGDIGDLLPKGARALGRRFVSHDRPAVPPAGADSMPGAAARCDSSSAAASHCIRGGTPAGGARLTRADVVGLLEVATERMPADLTGRDLSGLDLSGVDFKQANLTRSRLVATNLTGARLFGTTLSGAVARDAILNRANLDVAVLRGTDLTGASLRDASMYATIMIGADLTGADASNARVIAVLSDAKLPRARLVNAHMGADPGNQPMGLMRTDLTGADLREADLTGADLRKTNLTRADLTGANVSGADVRGADLTGTILRALRGRATLRGLDAARNLDKAITDTPDGY